MTHDPIDIEARKVQETAKAYLLDVGMDKPIWFTKSEVEFDGETLTCREEYAIEKGAV